MKSLQQYILESKERIEVGGITFKEGDRVIYLKKYKDENGDNIEEEIEGTIDEIFPSKKINIEFSEGKFAVISSSDLVGLCQKSKTYKFKTSSKVEDKYYDELDDINYEIDNKISEIDDLNNNMEEDILYKAQELFHKDHPDDEFDKSKPECDKYLDKAGSEWADTSGLNKLEKELEELQKKKEQAQKKLDDYLAKDGKTISKEGKIKYINGYKPIE